MLSKHFLGKQLKPNQDIVSFIGPSGTGKTFCANFLETFGYKIAPQITTREKRPDDVHYTYMSHGDFVNGIKNGTILGYYSGNEETLSGGNGYGYHIETLNELLQNPNAKLILFPSAYELSKPNFLELYGNTTKFALAFKNPSTVATRAMYAGKVFSDTELQNRINIVNDLTNAMLYYKLNSDDSNFHLIYSDQFGSDKTLSEKKQLEVVCNVLGIKKQAFVDAFVNYSK